MVPRLWRRLRWSTNDVHALKTILEAEAYPGPSIIIAYSHCIAYGYDMSHGIEQQNLGREKWLLALVPYNPMKEKGQRSQPRQQGSIGCVK